MPSNRRAGECWAGESIEENKECPTARDSDFPRLDSCAKPTQSDLTGGISSGGQRLNPRGERRLPTLRQDRLQGRDYLFARDAFGCRNRSQNRVQCSNAKRSVIRHGKPMMPGRLRLEDDVAALLVDLCISPTTDECRRDLPAADVTGQLHTNTSSRTKCSRKRAGWGRSK
jgi:hypothetical protein